jgi:5S rRNA maturation endonuclease (ribonuclease M5)
MISNNQISLISKKLIENLNIILEHFEIEYSETNTRFFFSCPAHNGDNNNACTIYKNTGVWNCHTALCHEKYKKTIIGFIRGVLCSRLDKDISFLDSVSYGANLVGLDIKSDIDLVDFNKQQKLANYNKLYDIFMKTNDGVGEPIHDNILEVIKIPSAYYIRRGYTEAILRKFNVGDCYDRSNPMFNRAVVPIYDVNKNYVGCSARATTEGYKPKWKNTEGMLKTNYIYGLDQAYDEIKRTGVIFLVEGPGDLWRMHEANYNNTGALFGVALTEAQLILLESLPISDIILATDSDKAGNEAAEKIKKQLQRKFNVRRLLTNYKDIGENQSDKLKEIIDKVWLKF